MATYLVPPGAWLSGSGLRADLKPTGPPGSGNRPVGPPGSSDQPTGPPQALSARLAWSTANAELQPTGPPTAVAPRTTVDPEWVYLSHATVLAQALRKSRSKVSRPSDRAQVTPAEQEARRLSGRPLGGTHLWRWAPQFRIETVLCELAGRFAVQGTAVWHLDLGRSTRGTVARRLLFALDPLPAMPDEQVDKVLRAAVEREDRLPEILSQADDFWPFFESVVGVGFAQAPHLFELVTVAQSWSMQLLMGLKHALAARRPFQYSTLVMPAIPTPGHGSVPSGHATVAALTAELLYALFYSGRTDTTSVARAEVLDRLARRIAFNRVVAGVHFPVDSLVGYALGTQLARAFLALADPQRFRFPAPVEEAALAALDPGDPAAGPALLDRPGRELPESGGPLLRRRFAPAPAARAAELEQLWARACDELDLLRV